MSTAKGKHPSAGRGGKAPRRPSRGRGRRGRYRPYLFWGIVVAVVVVAGHFINEVIYPKLPPPSGNIVDVTADMSGFNRSQIRVKVGEPVTIRLTSLDTQFHTDGGGKHQLAIDALGVNIIAPPKGSSWQTFTPKKPGVYDFYCSVCCGGKANPSMHGKLIVEA